MATQPLVIQSQPVSLPRWLGLLVWSGRKLGRIARILAPSPAVWAVTAVLVGSAAIVRAVPWLIFALMLLVPAVLGFWRMNFPNGYANHVTGRVRGTARSLFVYRWRWGRALRRSGVISNIGGLPLLARTSSTPVYDRLKVRMVAGQRVEDFADESERLAQSFGALACRTRAVQGGPHWVELMFLAKDPLTKDVRPYPPDPGWRTGLPIAVREDGQTWYLRLVGSHVLLVGATGSGKSSVMWAIIDQLIPAINDRLAKLWVLDPKGGMEMAAGQQYFNKFCYGTEPAEYAQLLEQAVRVMKARQARLRGVTREHTPTTDEPLIVVIVDEMAALTAWATGEARQRIQNALALLLSQGRAVGVSVIGAVQDPRKDTVPMRGLFTIRICLRVNEADEVPMVLGRNALNRGAKCHEIPRTSPGVGYVEIEGDPTPERVRFAHVTDSMIKDFRAGPSQQAEAEQTAPAEIFIA
jgi:S-DNA-T family DNA segregation ATPase FtsK/SpoIIIE